MQDSRGDRDRGINLGITAGCNAFHVIRKEIVGYSFASQDVNCFVVGNGSFHIGSVTTDQVISTDMDADSIKILSVFVLGFPDTVIDVIDFQILSAEIGRVVIYKAIIHAGDAIAFDPVSGGKRKLHAVVGYKIVISAAHDLMGRIIEEIFHVEFQYMMRRQIVIKKLLPQINGIAEIQSIVS